MNDVTMNETFQTSDFQLATFLFAKGVSLEAILDSPYDNRRKVFVFRNAPQDFILDFQAGNAEVGVFAFTNAQNTLRDKLRGK